ncbi:MAG: hypothetical protein JEY99_05305 [Spirochaetales bacterium]|nr:hypothetical protein [Spirochaetales bacterium]
MKKQMLFVVLLVFGLVSTFADGSQGVNIDGQIMSGEYSNTKELRKASLFWEVEGDDLRIAIHAETDGWIAVGLGSARMDGSEMFMGYFKNGESFFEEHLGKGHSHSKVENNRDVEFALMEDDGFTFFEFKVKKSDFISAGQNDLPVILAYGTRDNFRSMHRYRDSTVLDF